MQGVEKRQVLQAMNKPKPKVPATAYRDAEGWVLFDADRNVIEDWPVGWPKTVDATFLEMQGVQLVQRPCSVIGRRMIQDTIASCAGTASILSEVCPEAVAIIRLCDSMAKKLRKLSLTAPLEPRIRSPLDP